MCDGDRERAPPLSTAAGDGALEHDEDEQEQPDEDLRPPGAEVALERDDRLDQAEHESPSMRLDFEFDHVLLKAEPGRRFRLTYTARDWAGNTVDQVVYVTVAGMSRPGPPRWPPPHRG